MIRFLIIILSLFFNYSDAQILSGQILDIITHKAIDGVNLGVDVDMKNKFDFEPFTRFMDNNIKKQWTMNVDIVVVLEK